MRPDLGHIEDVPAVLLCLLGLHDLEVHGPGRIVTILNRIVHISGMMVGVLSCNLICFRLREVLDALMALEVDFDINEAGLYIE
jgi:hypothetical protein